MSLSAPCPRPIFIVAAAADDRFFLERLLKNAGVVNPTRSFEDGRSVVEFFGTETATPQTELPAWMFLDLNMPRMSGHDVLRRLRSRPNLKTVRIVVLSGSTLYSEVRLAAELGADFYFEKFPSPETIRRVVKGEKVRSAELLAQACAG